MAQPKVVFQKHWTNIPSQVAILKSRGLSVADDLSVAEFLTYVNYYRFTGYCLRFQFPPDPSGVRMFRPGTTFDDVRDLYDIDRTLRDVLAAGLELVEISVRAAIADVFGAAYDAMGHLEAMHFASAFTLPTRSGEPTPFDIWLENVRREVRRSRELFVQHFKGSYLGYPDLPIWMTCEIASFGSMSKFYQNMLRSEQRVIANRYGLQATTLDSWLHAFVYLRNVCAHHARLWDRSLSITPGIPPGKRWAPVVAAPRNTLYPIVMALNGMLLRGPVPRKAVDHWRSAVDQWGTSFESRFPGLVSHTGFPSGWRSFDIWAKP